MPAIAVLRLVRVFKMVRLFTKARSLRMLIKSGTAGRVIGREGAGLRSLRALGVSVDLPREEHLPGERVCTINGPPLAVAQAVASVCEAQVS